MSCIMCEFHDNHRYPDAITRDIQTYVKDILEKKNLLPICECGDNATLHFADHPHVSHEGCMHYEPFKDISQVVL